jgi:hypothetical protein
MYQQQQQCSGTGIHAARCLESGQTVHYMQLLVLAVVLLVHAQ